jgi:hypothetical protein
VSEFFLQYPAHFHKSFSENTLRSTGHSPVARNLFAALDIDAALPYASESREDTWNLMTHSPGLERSHLLFAWP